MAAIAAAYGGLEEARKQFGKDGFPREVLNWLKRFPRLFSPGRPIIGYAQTMQVGQTSEVSVTMKHIPKSGASDHELIESLEKNVDLLFSGMSGLEQRLSSKTDSLAEVGAATKAALSQEDQKLGEQLKKFSVGGIGLATAGLIWLAFGITFATIPGELAHIFGCG
jgi:hypothetical protein